MKILVLLIIILTSCESNKDKENLYVDMKYCIDGCLENRFQIFHGRGRSWGTGSSSMNGLSQKQIYDRVIKYCEVFLKGEKCCTRYFRSDTSIISGRIFKHSFTHDYGICADEKLNAS